MATETEVVEGELVGEETSLAVYFEEGDDLTDYGDEDFILADPEDDPLAEIGAGLHRIKADGSDGVFYDDKEALGNELIVVIIDKANTKHFWVPDKGAKPELDALLDGFPQDKPVCYNTDQFHEEAKLHKELTEEQRNIMRSKGAGSWCRDCGLFSDCGFGVDLLVMNDRYEEPVVISFAATSAVPLRDFFRKEFKHRGQSIALSTFPVRLTFQEVRDKDPKTGKPRKYHVITPKRGKKLPNEKVKAYLGLRDIYRISNKKKGQNALGAGGGSSSAPSSSPGTAPRQAQAPMNQPVGDPENMSEEDMF